MSNARSERALLWAFTVMVMSICSTGLELRFTGIPVDAWAEESASAILARARHLDEGARDWSDRTQQQVVRVIGKDGTTEEHDVVMFSKRSGRESERTRVCFRSSPNLQGAGFLEQAEPNREEVRWLFLPELRRARRLGLDASGDSFGGADLAIGDLRIVDVVIRANEDDVVVRREPDEEVGEALCHRLAITRVPRNVLSYTSIRLWLRIADLIPVRLELSRSNEVVKALRLSDVQISDGIPSPRYIGIHNYRTDGDTSVHVTTVEYNRGLRDDLFTERALENGCK
jgi:hypothetical protein